jgi:hypothetical protein
MAVDDDQAVNAGCSEGGGDVGYDLVEGAGADADGAAPSGVLV